MIRSIENLVELVLSTKVAVLKKINVSFIIHYRFGKYSLSIDSFFDKPRIKEL